MNFLDKIIFPRRNQFKKECDGIFKDWTFDYSSFEFGEIYKITNGKYNLWVANCFYGFKDYQPDKSQFFLSLLKRWQRKILWEEYKKEKKERDSKDFKSRKMDLLDSTGINI